MAQPEPIDLGSLAGDITPAAWAHKHPESTAHGINDLGQVVGSSIVSWSGLDPATDPPIEHAFVWTPQAGMVDLGTLVGGPAAAGGTSVASAINNQGQVVGWSETVFGETHAFIVRPEDSDGDGLADRWFKDDDLDQVNDLMVDLGTLGGVGSRALYINDLGQVVGESTTELGENHAFRWTEAEGMTDLGVLGGLAEFSSSANRLSEGGQVVGQSTTATGEKHAYRRTAEGDVQDLGVLGELLGSWSDARSVNGAGQVVGTSLTDDGQEHAFLWSLADGMRDLGTLGGLPGSSSHASDINAAGQVVGASTTDANEKHGFLWAPVGGMIDLGTLGGGESEAAAINDLGQVAGTSKTAAGQDRAFVWTAEEGMRDLGTLGGTSSESRAINDSGQAVGTSQTAGGFTHATLWSVSSEPTIDIAVFKLGPFSDIPQGRSFDYRINIANEGTETAPSITITDVLPSEVSFRSFNAIGGSISCSFPPDGGRICTNGQGVACSQGLAGVPEAQITCTTEDLPGDTFRTAGILVEAIAVGTATNTVVATTSGLVDPDPTNNTSTQVTTIISSADLALIASSPGNEVVGSTFDYTFTVSNNGPGTATGVVLTTDMLPPEVTLVSTTPGSCTGTESISCDLGSLASGASTSAVVTVNAIAAGSAALGASVTGLEPDLVSANDSDSATTTITEQELPPGADLLVSISGPEIAEAGQTISLEFTVTNNGPDPATNVSLAYTLPDALDVRFRSTPGSTCSSILDNPTTCDLGTLDNADSKTVTISGDLPAELGSYVSTASATTDSDDPDSTNNSASLTTTVPQPETDIAVFKLGPFSDLTVGQTFEYRINISNEGTLAAPRVELTDVLPPEVSFQSFSAIGGRISCTFPPGGGRICTNGQDVTCSQGLEGVPDAEISCSTEGLPGGSFRTAGIRVEATSPGLVVNTVTATGVDLVDPDMSNNTSTKEVTIVPPNSPPVADAQSLTAEGRLATPVTLTGSDPDGDAITFAVVTQPDHGSLTGTAPDLTYTSDPGFTGADSFTFKANDGLVDSDPATVSITVVDTTPPVLTVPPDVTAEATAIDTPVDIGAADADDLVDGPVTPSNDAPSTYPLGTTVVTWTATDSSGNSATATQEITVVDTTPPVIVVPDDVTVEATAVLTAVDIGQATASDIFPVTTANDAPAGGFPLGLTVVTWTATDANGNSASAIQKVTIVDTTPPVLRVPADVTAEANAVLSTVDIGQATATDIFPVAIANDAPDRFPLGLTTVTWTASDTSGNTTSGTQDVTVVDTTPPVLSVPPDLSVEATGPLTVVDIGEASATDIFAVTIVNDAPASFPLGTTVVTWTATDANFNATEATQQVTVVDTTPPSVVAALEPLGRGDDDEDDDEGRFRVRFSVSDLVDPAPEVVAVLIAGARRTIAVRDGQVIEYERDDEGVEIEKEGRILEIEAPTLRLRVTATDFSGNTGVAEAQPIGLMADNDREDEDDD